MFEAEVNKLQGARITLDSQMMSLESASVTIGTLEAMKQGADAMKKLRGNMFVTAAHRCSLRQSKIRANHLPFPLHK